MKIYVVGSSKNRFLPLNNIREKFIINAEHDGENIDNLNPWFCELTGLYWIWKNSKEDIVGLEHYRRYFVNQRNQLLSEDEIRTILEANDIICVRANYSYRNPPKTWLIKTDKWNEMQKFLIFCKNYIGQEYYDACIEHLNGDWHALGNMFISRKEVIDKYCSFIFDVLTAYMEAEKHYGRELPRRIIGYFTEFLFGAWLIYNKMKISFNGIKIIR